MADVRSLEEQINAYEEKQAYLKGQFGDPVEPYAFYRDLFPEGSLQKSYKVDHTAKKNGKYTAIANVMYTQDDQTHYRKNQFVTDDLSVINKLKMKVAYIAPCTFVGSKKGSDNLRYMHALVVDLDYVNVQHIKNLLYQTTIGYVPRPTYIVNSGTGLHLYFMLKEPLHLYKSQQSAIKALKDALIGLCWNSDTSLGEDKQFSGLVQPYRVIGSRTKLDCDKNGNVIRHIFPVCAWKTGDKWTVDQIASFKPSINVELYWWDDGIERYNRLTNPDKDDKDHLTREKAKKLYPDWYHARIELGMPVKPISKDNKWHTSENVYQNWLQRISHEGKPGHRYYCIMTLAIYGLKCDVPFEQVKRDAYGLLDIFESKTDDETNHFLKSDIDQALQAYHQDSLITFPNTSISHFSGLTIEKNRRNGRSQNMHLARARAVQNVDDPDGIWRNKDGRPKGAKDKKPRRTPKKEEIRSYAEAHPDISNRSIAQALGVSRNTVNKWLK